MPEAKLIDNPNIGVLGGAEFQKANDRVKGFCPVVIHSSCEYLAYLYNNVLPIAKESGASRIIDRAIIINDKVNLSSELAPHRLSIEAAVQLGGRWENHTWIMVGGNKPGRILSPETSGAIKTLIETAKQFCLEPVKPLPKGYLIKCLKDKQLSNEDLTSLVEIFGAAFSAYLTPMTDRDFLSKWVMDISTMPFVVRNETGVIIAIANADVAEMSFVNDHRSFKFVEIGDSATHPNLRGEGLNRNIKATIIKTAKQLGYDSIHTETRASWGAPNFGNAKNGMQFCGTLWNNCVIKGPEDVAESKDPQLADWAKNFGSLNVWAMTPANPHWSKY